MVLQGIDATNVWRNWENMGIFIGLWVLVPLVALLISETYIRVLKRKKDAIIKALRTRYNELLKNGIMFNSINYKMIPVNEEKGYIFTNITNQSGVNISKSSQVVFDLKEKTEYCLIINPKDFDNYIITKNYIKV